MAIGGPRNAPSGSIDCRSPKARPRISGDVTPATSVSRGAPRSPLPIRSANRAPMITGAVPASANSGLDSAPRPYPIRISGFRLPVWSQR